MRIILNLTRKSNIEHTYEPDHIYKSEIIDLLTINESTIYTLESNANRLAEIANNNNNGRDIAFPNSDRGILINPHPVMAKYLEYALLSYGLVPCYLVNGNFYRVDKFNLQCSTEINRVELDYEEELEGESEVGVE